MTEKSAELATELEPKVHKTGDAFSLFLNAYYAPCLH